MHQGPPTVPQPQHIGAAGPEQQFVSVRAHKTKTINSFMPTVEPLQSGQAAGMFIGAMQQGHMGRAPQLFQQPEDPFAVQLRGKTVLKAADHLRHQARPGALREMLMSAQAASLQARQPVLLLTAKAPRQRLTLQPRSCTPTTRRRRLWWQAPPW